MHTLLVVVMVLGGLVAYYMAGLFVSFAAQARYRKPYDQADWDSLILLWPALVPGLLRDALRSRARRAKRR